MWLFTKLYFLYDMLVTLIGRNLFSFISRRRPAIAPRPPTSSSSSTPTQNKDAHVIINMETQQEISVSSVDASNTHDTGQSCSNLKRSRYITN
jgi:hypothetical protein